MELQQRTPQAILRWAGALCGAVAVLLAAALALFLTGYPLRALAQGDVQISVPAVHDLPPNSLDPQTVTVFAERLRLVVTEAPHQALVLMWCSSLLSALCFLIAALTCVVLCYRLARQVPFGAFMQRCTAATGVLALAAGVAVAILEGYAKYLTVHSLPGLLAGGNAVGVGTPGVYIVDSLNPVLFVIGLILLLLAAELSALLTTRDMTLTELSKRVGISLVNLSLLKNGHAKAIRFSTLHAICQALECEVGDLLTISPKP